MILVKTIFNYQGNFESLGDYRIYKSVEEIPVETNPYKTLDVPPSIKKLVDERFPSKVDAQKFVKELGWIYNIGQNTLRVQAVKIAFLDEQESGSRCSASIRYRFGDFWCTGREILSSLKKVL